MNAFVNGDLDLKASSRFERPVYFALGARSNPDFFARIAERLAATFPDFTLETFAERHHFDPAHRAEPSASPTHSSHSGSAPSPDRV